MRLEGMNVFFQCLFEVIREILIGYTFQPLLKFSNELPLGGNKRRPHSFRPALRGPCSELRRLGFELRESSRLEGRRGWRPYPVHAFRSPRIPTARGIRSREQSRAADSSQPQRASEGWPPQARTMRAKLRRMLRIRPKWLFCSPLADEADATEVFTSIRPASAAPANE